MAMSYPYEMSYVDDSDQSTTLFLGDLSIHCDEKDLRELFHPFGIIEAIRVKRNGTDHSSLSYGFLKYSTRESAETAMLHLSGVMFCGRSLKIRWAESKTAFKPKMMKERKTVETAQLHVSFFTKQVELLITEATLRALFGMCGEVVDVALKKSQVDQNMQVQSGYGFVHYALTPEGIRSALMAVQNIHRKCIDQVTYDCSISRSLQEHLAATNSLTNIVTLNSITTQPTFMGNDLPVAGIADEYQVSKSMPHNMMCSVPSSLSNSPDYSMERNAYETQVSMAHAAGRAARVSQPLPRHPNSQPPMCLGNNMDRRQRLAMNAGVSMPPAPPSVAQPFYRSTSPYQQQPQRNLSGEFEPHGMMYHGEMNTLEDSFTTGTGTRSPSVCSSVDHHFDAANISGSTSYDGISLVSSPATQKDKVFTFGDDGCASSIDSFNGLSLGFSPNSLNIVPPANNQGAPSVMRTGLDFSFDQPSRLPMGGRSPVGTIAPPSMHVPSAYANQHQHHPSMNGYDNYGYGYSKGVAPGSASSGLHYPSNSSGYYSSHVALPTNPNYSLHHAHPAYDPRADRKSVV